MKLRKLQQIVEQAIKNAGDTDPDVRLCIERDVYKGIAYTSYYDIKVVSQGSIIPDVMINLEFLTREE